jgi:8-oxo-dGTP pyrophosphatase MutT (NUDIX family)
MDTEKNPWTTLSTRPIYDNPWISIREDQIINPTGGKGIYGVVSFKNIAIGIIPIDSEGNTYLIGQYRYTLNEYSWEIPMGGGKIGISILDSAQRELKEETGFTALQWTEITKLHTSNSVTDEVAYVFIAEELMAGETEFEETEQLQIKKLPFTEVVNMVMRGEITDAISVAGILKLALLRKI